VSARSDLDGFRGGAYPGTGFGVGWGGARCLPWVRGCPVRVWVWPCCGVGYGRQWLPDHHGLWCRANSRPSAPPRVVVFAGRAGKRAAVPSQLGSGIPCGPMKRTRGRARAAGSLFFRLRSGGAACCSAGTWGGRTSARLCRMRVRPLRLACGRVAWEGVRRRRRLERHVKPAHTFLASSLCGPRRSGGERSELLHRWPRRSGGERSELLWELLRLPGDIARSYGPWLARGGVAGNCDAGRVRRFRLSAAGLAMGCGRGLRRRRRCVPRPPLRRV
jgi:hypothetical protein